MPHARRAIASTSRKSLHPKPSRVCIPTTFLPARRLLAPRKRGVMARGSIVHGAEGEYFRHLGPGAITLAPEASSCLPRHREVCAGVDSTSQHVHGNVATRAVGTLGLAQWQREEDPRLACKRRAQARRKRPSRPRDMSAIASPETCPLPVVT